MRIDVVRAGFLTSVQDLGRFGFRQFGVSTAGVLDTHALRVANLLVGNEESAAGLEVTLGGLQLQFADERLIAWCGGEFDVRLGATSLPAGHACLLHAGELTISQSKIGCRAWIAISGGIDVPLVLGSRSTDLRASFGGLNGRALDDGDEIPLGKQSDAARSLADLLREQRISSWSPPAEWTSTAKREPILRIVRGTDWNRFNTSMHHALTSEPFTVSSDSDRMGARLDGPELRRDDNLNLVSEAVAPGTIQIPPNGQPILLLGDCQTIGGYPKIAHVITVDLPMAAQLRAGDRVRFREVPLATAHQLLIDRERDLEQFRCGLLLRT
jgi:antagonist of KipI